MSKRLVSSSQSNSISGLKINISLWMNPRGEERSDY